MWPNITTVPGSQTQGVLYGGLLGALVGHATTVGTPMGAAFGLMVGGSIGNYLSSHEGFAQKLEQTGINITTVGEDVKFTVPLSRAIPYAGTTIDPRYRGALNGIAEMIKHYDKIEVKVAGFSDNRGDCHKKLTLTAHQAQIIANYLMRRGIDARLLYSVGYGCQYPIASNKMPFGRLRNRRVEITLRRIPAGPV